MSQPKYFGSDNQAPAHPAILEALNEANTGNTLSYGDDPWTARAQELFRTHFGPAARAFPVFNGTGANVLALAALLRPQDAVLCARDAHVDVDEGGAPERFGGFKLVPLATQHGKFAPEALAAQLGSIGDPHRVQPRAKPHPDLPAAQPGGQRRLLDHGAPGRMPGHARGLVG